MRLDEAGPVSSYVRVRACQNPGEIDEQERSLQPLSLRAFMLASCAASCKQHSASQVGSCAFCCCLAWGLQQNTMQQALQELWEKALRS